MIPGWDHQGVLEVHDGRSFFRGQAGRLRIPAKENRMALYAPSGKANTKGRWLHPI